MTLRPLSTTMFLNRFLALAVVFMAFSGTALAASDASCLQRAGTDRASQLKTAFNDYNDVIKKAQDRLAKAENDALKNKDSTYAQNELTRVRQTYRTDLDDAARTLAYRQQAVWSDYQSKQYACGYVAGSGATVIANGGFQYPFTGGWGYPYSQPYGYGYGSYPYSNYGYGFGYNPASPYGYGTNYAPYGGYNGGYGYANYAYPQHGIYLYGGYPYDPQAYSYPYQFQNFQQSFCPMLTFAQLPIGCGYDCSRDVNGCPRCEVSCKNQPITTPCVCPSEYAPICAGDGRTYTSACTAQCAGVHVVHGGPCI